MVVHFTKNIFSSFFLLIVIILGASYTLLAQIAPNTNGIVFVNKSVSGGNQSGNSWANAVPELADALLSAHSNNSIQQIWVAKGTYAPKYSAGADNIVPTLQFGTPHCGYFGSLVLVNNVKLYGGFQNANETSITQRDTVNNNTILSGLDSFVHVVMSVGNVGSAELNGFTIKEGKSYPYQLLYVNGQPTHSGFGGGVYMQNTNLSIKNCTISDNNANLGGGIYAENSSLTLKHTALLNNNAIGVNGSTAQGSSAAYGGGAYFLNGFSLTIDSCDISNNSAISTSTDAVGGGFYVAQSNTFVPVNISNTTFHNNGAYLNLASGANPYIVRLFGGGLTIINPHQLSYISKCTFSNNTLQLSAQNATLSTTNHNQVNGAGIFSGAPLVLNNCIVNNNKLIANINPSNNPKGYSGGAGIGVDGARGAGGGVNLTISNTIIEGNEASGNFRPSGGGISYYTFVQILPTTIKPKINNSIIRNNSAQFGGAIHCIALAPVLKNTLLQGNIASEGNVLYNEGQEQPAHPQIINCTIFGNKAASATTPIIANNNGSTTTLHNSIIYNNTGVLSSTSNIAMHSIIEGNTLFPGVGNKNQNPQFVNTSSGNFELLNTSPAANAGSNALYTAAGNVNSDTDLAGNPRLYENTIDMGAFELQTKAIIDTSTSTSIQQIDPAAIKLFPNPVLAGQSIQLALNLPAGYSKGALLMITDASGKQVGHQEVWEPNQPIKAPQTPGTYFISIQFKNGAKTSTAIMVR
ncbi:MAG: T9SS type A sorting domain-containing protein [Sphingobacteriales bacterium]|nr:MAG: T9SS type A sorting domain-containing protein [Sphingobacteriales bacterium]